MNELLLLLAASEHWPQRPSVFITTLDILADGFGKGGNVYVIGECDRKRPLQAIGVLIRALCVVLKERPDAIVTTGSLPLAMVCLMGKLMGSRVVWIDSIANVERLSMSGRLVRRFADLCLSQWPEVAARYPNVEYAGELL